MEIETVVVTPFQQNARIIYDESTRRGSVIDPGGDITRIMDTVRSLGVVIESIVLTHSHIDHAGGVKRLLSLVQAQEGRKIQLLAHSAESGMRSTIRAQAAMFGVQDPEVDNCPEPDMFLEDGERVEIGGESAEVLFTPGHSPGHVSLYFDDDETPILIAGDVIFKGSVGRTDLPGGDSDTLISSVESKIFTLPEHTIIMCGHGPDTTVGHEKRFNPFFN